MVDVSVLSFVATILIISTAFNYARGNPEFVYVTVVPQNSSSIDYSHVRIFNGTPYDDHFAALHNWKIRTSNTRLYACDLDVSRNLLYVFDARTSSIDVVDNIQPGDGKAENIHQFHQGVSRSVFLKIAVDWISNNVYWADPHHRWIAVQPGTNRNTDRSLYKVLIDDGLVQPTALALDPIEGFLFWSNSRSSPTIDRSNLQGTERKTIIHRGLVLPTSIAVDRSASEIYWVDYTRDTVEKSDYGGKNRRMIVRMQHSALFDIALYKNSMIVTDLRLDRILFMNKITGTINDAYITNNDRFYGVSVFSNTSQPYVSENKCIAKNCGEFCIGGGTDEASCICRTGYVLQVDGVTCIEDEGKYYRAFVVSNSTHICRVTIQMASHDALYRCTKQLTRGVIGDEIQFLDVDSNNAEFIYTTQNEVFKIDTNGLNKRKLTESIEPITGMSLDWINGNIYLSFGPDSGRVGVLSGTNFVTIFNTSSPRSVVVDPHNQKLYWIAGTSGSTIIEGSSMDGSDRRIVVLSGHLEDPRSLILDAELQKLYWTDKGYIMISTVDGMNIQRVDIDTGFTNPHLLLIYKEFLLWTEEYVQGSSHIHVVLKSTPRTKVVKTPLSIFGSLNSLRVKDPTLQKQERGPCEPLNGGCEHICLPVGQARECRCQYGFKLDDNAETCSSKTFFDNFIIFTDWTHNTLYQVSLETGNVTGLKTGTIGRPTGVVFDYMRNNVIWGESGEAAVNKFNLQSSETDIISDIGYLFSALPDRFAIDNTNGNIYYTAVPISDDGFAGVGVLSLEGKHKKLVVSGNQTRAIVLDSEEGLMIWTDHEQKKVWRAFMDGSGQTEVFVSSDTRWPNGIAIDRHGKIVYISDGYTDKIHRCSYLSLTECYVVHQDPGAHLMGIFLSGKYLYYTAWNRPYITRIDTVTFTNILRLAHNPELGRLDDVYVYNSSEVVQNSHEMCSPNNGKGPCSTFCLPKGRDSFTCACEDDVFLTEDGYRCENTSPSSSTTVATTGAVTVLNSSETSTASNLTLSTSSTTNGISTDNSSGRITTKTSKLTTSSSSVSSASTFKANSTSNILSTATVSSKNPTTKINRTTTRPTTSSISSSPTIAFSPSPISYSRQTAISVSTTSIFSTSRPTLNYSTVHAVSPSPRTTISFDSSTPTSSPRPPTNPITETETSSFPQTTALFVSTPLTSSFRPTTNFLTTLQPSSSSEQKTSNASTLTTSSSQQTNRLITTAPTSSSPRPTTPFANTSLPFLRTTNITASLQTSSSSQQSSGIVGKSTTMSSRQTSSLVITSLTSSTFRSTTRFVSPPLTTFTRPTTNFFTTLQTSSSPRSITNVSTLTTDSSQQTQRFITTTSTSSSPRPTTRIVSEPPLESSLPTTNFSTSLRTNSFSPHYTGDISTRTTSSSRQTSVFLTTPNTSPTLRSTTRFVSTPVTKSSQLTTFFLTTLQTRASRQTPPFVSLTQTSSTPRPTTRFVSTSPTRSSLPTTNFLTTLQRSSSSNQITSFVSIPQVRSSRPTTSHVTTLSTNKFSGPTPNYVTTPLTSSIVLPTTSFDNNSGTSSSLPTTSTSVRQTSIPTSKSTSFKSSRATTIKTSRSAEATHSLSTAFSNSGITKFTSTMGLTLKPSPTTSFTFGPTITSSSGKTATSRQITTNFELTKTSSSVTTSEQRIGTYPPGAGTTSTTSTTLAQNLADNLGDTSTNTDSSILIVFATCGGVAIIIIIVLSVLLYKYKMKNRNLGETARGTDRIPFSDLSSVYDYIQDTSAVTTNSGGVGNEPRQSVNNHTQEGSGQYDYILPNGTDSLQGIRPYPYRYSSDDGNVPRSIPFSNPAYETEISSDVVSSGGTLNSAHNQMLIINDDYVSFGNEDV